MAAAAEAFTRPRTIWPAAVQAALLRWGEWQIRLANLSGYSPRSALARIGEVAEGGLGGHAVLIPDVPAAVVRVHAAWLRLPEIYREAVYAKYALPCRADGTVMTAREVARALGVSLACYRSRCLHGRSLIGRELALLAPVS